MTDDEPDPQIEAFRRGFRGDLSAAVGDQKTFTLASPSLEYRGFPDDEESFAMVHWNVEITMQVIGDEDDDSTDIKRIGVGYLQLFSLPVDGSAWVALDAISQDTAEYLPLISHGDIADEVADQFDNPFITGLLILDRAYIHPAMRGHDLGPWAVVQAIGHLTFGSGEAFVAAYPTPTEDRTGVTEAAARKRIAKHWAKAGLQSIKAVPDLVGQPTFTSVIDHARKQLDGVGDLELTLAVGDLA